MSTAVDTLNEPAEAPVGAGMDRVTLLAAGAVVLQVILLWRVDIGPLVAIPNLVVVVVVAIGMLRGVVVGAVTGFVAGLLVELTTPGDSLGVLALAYVAIGAWCGRFAERPEPPRRFVFVLLAAVAGALIPLWMGAIGVLRGDGLDLGYLVGRLATPHFVFAFALAWPVWWVCRRVLGEPRVVEPWGGAS
jgi:cell shape-determining protein MreD